MAIPILAGHICNFTNDLNTVFSLKKRGKLVLPLGLLGNNDFFPDNQKLLFYCERIGVTKLLMPQVKLKLMFPDLSVFKFG
jgi:hypothetical protein